MTRRAFGTVTVGLSALVAIQVLVACASPGTEQGFAAGDGGPVRTREGGLSRIDSSPEPGPTTTPGPTPTSSSSAAPPASSGSPSSGACVPKYTLKDPVCSDCARAKCCAEFNAFRDNSQSTALSTCYDACPTTGTGVDACYTSCDAKYPSAGAAFATFSNCAGTNCKTECGGSSSGSGGVCGTGLSSGSALCDSCLGQYCCAEAKQYSTDQTPLNDCMSIYCSFDCI